MDYYNAQTRRFMSIFTTEALPGGVAYSHDNANAGGPSQTDSPFQSPIDSMTQSLDTVSPTEVSSTNESPTNLSPHAVDAGHQSLYSSFHQEVFPQSSDIGVYNPHGFQVTSHSIPSPTRVDSVNAGSELEVAYNNNLIPYDDHDVMLEESFTENARPDHTGHSFTCADAFFQTQSRYNPSHMEGQLAFNLPLGAVHADQNINAGTMFAEYPHLDMEESPSPNSSIESDEPQPKTTEETADEKTGPHHLVDLRTVSEDFLYNFCIKDNGKGTFRCDFGKCVAGRSSGSFSTLEEINQHIREEKKSRPFACGYDPCKERFKTKSDCDRHVKSKNNPNAFVCEFCGGSFGRNDARKQHTLNRHTAAPQENDSNPPSDKDQRTKTRTKKSNGLKYEPYSKDLP